MKTINAFENYTDEKTFARIVDYKNIAEMWDASVSEFCDNVAIIDGEDKYTFGEFAGSSL